MKAPDRIAIIKTGWSDDYRGDPVVGAYKFLDDRGEGHERFNFMPGPDGSYYGYLPPIGRDWAVPNPKEKSGWLLVFVAKRPKSPGLYIVGWYSDAEFEPKYLPRPEYALGQPFEHDANGETFFYTLTAADGVEVPLPLRTAKLDTNRIKRTPIAYLRGNDSRDAWRENLAKDVLEQIERLQTEINLSSGAKPGNRKPFVPPSTEHRKAVEEASMREVSKALKSDGYKVEDVSKNNPGYDLLATRSKAPKELHVEVKGTSGATRQFLMSRNEHNRIDEPQWRLGMVTQALNDPDTKILDKAAVKSMFSWEIFTWLATEK